jgi:hypothetical protein
MSGISTAVRSKVSAQNQTSATAAQTENGILLLLLRRIFIKGQHNPDTSPDGIPIQIGSGRMGLSPDAWGKTLRGPPGLTSLFEPKNRTWDRTADLRPPESTVAIKLKKP